MFWKLARLAMSLPLFSGSSCHDRQTRYGTRFWDRASFWLSLMESMWTREKIPSLWIAEEPGQVNWLLKQTISRPLIPDRGEVFISRLVSESLIILLESKVAMFVLWEAKWLSTLFFSWIVGLVVFFHSFPAAKARWTKGTIVTHSKLNDSSHSDISLGICLSRNLLISTSTVLLVSFSTLANGAESILARNKQQ